MILSLYWSSYLDQPMKINQLTLICKNMKRKENTKAH